MRSMVAGKRFQPEGTVGPTAKVSGRTEIVTGVPWPGDTGTALTDQATQRSPNHHLTAEVAALALDLTLEQVGGTQQPRHEDVDGSIVKLGGWADLDNPPQVHHGQPVGQREGLVRVIRQGQGRDPRLPMNPPEIVQDSSRARGLRARSGASRISNSGSVTKARANAVRSRCCGVNCSGRRPARLSIRKTVSVSAMRCRRS